MARHQFAWIALLAFLVSLPTKGTAQQPGIMGSWKGEGGKVRVQPCLPRGKLCVVVTDGDDSQNSMTDLIGKPIIKDLVAAGPNIWRGTYIADGKNLAATITLQKPNIAQMRVCLLSWFPYLLCETPTYVRAVR